MVETLTAYTTEEKPLFYPSAKLYMGSMHEDNRSSMALGAYVDLESRPLERGWQMHLRMNRFESIHTEDPENMHFSNYLLDPEGNSYTLLNLASIGYRTDAFEGSLGRIFFDTPFADPDDFRLLPNSFEGFTLDYKTDEKARWKFFGAHKMSGIDAPVINAFEKLYTQSNGFLAWGYEKEIDATRYSLWGYHVDEMADIFYASYRHQGYRLLDSLTLKGMVGLASQREQAQSRVAGDVASIQLQSYYKEYMAGISMDVLDVEPGYTVSDGFGAGPFVSAGDLTSLGIASLMYPGQDINGFKFNIAKEHKRFSLEYAVSYFDIAGSEKDLYENNLFFKWRWSDAHLYVVATRGEHRQRPMNFLFIRMEYALGKSLKQRD